MQINYDLIEKYMDKFHKDFLKENTKTLLINYLQLDTYYPELTEELITNYHSITRNLEKHVEKMKIQNNPVKIKFNKVKTSVKIKDIHQKYNNKWISFEGIVKKNSKVFNHITHVHWTCKECGNDKVYKLDYKDKLYPPNENCRYCGRKSGYILNRQTSKYEDIQLFILQEDRNTSENMLQPAQIKCYLKDEMINTINPGDKIIVNGIVELQNKAKENMFEEYVTITNIEKIEKNFEDLNINKEEIKEIKKLSQEENIYNKIIKSTIPSLYGYEELKLAIALHLFSSDNHMTPDGSYKRGDIHILIIGDPSVGKSQILKYVSKLAPRGIYTSGKGASGAGLTATAIKDEMGGWSLEAGAMVLANNGNICIDEFDKMHENDRSAIHEALEQQSISISKAGINTTLNSRCSVLAAANPKLGRFNPYKDIGEQLNLNPTILSRFDLIFIITDDIDQERDKKIATKILKNQIDNKSMINHELLRKYISYSRKIDPEMTDEVINYIADFFTKIRIDAKNNQHPIPITTRQLEAIARLSKASARIRLCKKVTIDDAKRAINLQKYCMKQIGFDYESNCIEIDKIMGNPTSKLRKKVSHMLKEIENLSEEYDNKIPGRILREQLLHKGFSTQEYKELMKEHLNHIIYYDNILNEYSIMGQ